MCRIGASPFIEQMTQVSKGSSHGAQGRRSEPHRQCVTAVGTAIDFPHSCIVQTPCDIFYAAVVQ